MLSKLNNKIPWQIKLLFLMLAMAILPSLLISYSVINVIRNELKSNINMQLLYSASSVSSSINSKIKKSFEIIDLVKKTVENPVLDSNQKVAFIVSMVEEIDNVLSVGLFVKEDNIYASAIYTQKDYVRKGNNQITPIDNSLKQIDFSKINFGANKTSYITPPVFNRQIQLWVSTIIIKVNIPNMPKAYLAANINLNEIAEEVENSILSKIGYLFITDSSSTKFLSSKFNYSVPNQIMHEGIKLLNGESNATFVNNYSNSQEDNYVACYSYPNQTKWVVVALIKESSAYAVVKETFIFFALFLGLSIILSIITALLFSKHISKPIIKMANTSHLIANGNFDIPIEYTAKDSIGLLNNSLSGMGKQLKKNFKEIEEQKNQLEDYSKNLEVKVEERTNELSETNKELKKAYKRVLELNEEKDEFLGIAAHDLKNPLTAVSAFAEILKEDKDLSVEQHDDFLDEIAKASSRMFFIVKNLLDVNAIEQGKLNTQMQRVSLRAIVNEMSAQFKEEVAKKNINLIESFQTDETDVIADYNLALQVVQNVLSNAIKFSPFNKNIFLTVRNSPINENIELSIKDEGPGFTPADKEKLFKKFARLSARPTAGEHSSGLGLSIVKKLTEMMNGTIVLESESGKGAEFIITLQNATKEFKLDGENS